MKSVLFPPLALLVCSFAAIPAGAANLIVNGGFEEPAHDGDQVGVTSLPGWFVSENIDIVYTADWPAFEGNQAIDLSGCTQAGSYIAQVFPTVPGQRYRVSFWYANNIAVPQSTGIVRVKGNAVLIETTLSHSGSTQAAMNYTPYDADFVADALATELRFTHLTEPCSGLMLDAVEVSTSPLATPYFWHQPKSQVGFWGKSITFGVIAFGAPPLNFEWRKDDTAISGATNSSLLLTNLQMVDAGNYTVVITNVYGSITSNPALLTMNPAGVALALYAGVTIDGVPGLTYGIQTTSDLSNTNSWRGTANVTLITPSQFWLDVEPANQPRRYYRVVPGPITIP